jgi:L-threonylcarbamoyladenylate synthase
MPKLCRFAFFAALRKTSFSVKTILTESPAEAAEFINRGGLVAFPTETVYGLGAAVFNESAIKKIFDAKQRPADNPLIAHVSDFEQISLLTSEITESAEKFITAFFPGPLTIVLTKRLDIPECATAGLNTIGIRMPRLGLARKFLAACKTPVVAPSANLSGRPSPTTWQAVAEDLDGRIDCILEGASTEIGLESTVVDCTSAIPIILRSGSISAEQLREIMPETQFYAKGGDETPRSPGMKHKHYSPRARVVLTDFKSEISHLLTDNVAYIGLTHHRTRDLFKETRVFESVEEYARSLFEFFRECDRQGVDTIVCEIVNETGVGTALMDRLRRAAAND